LNLDVADSALDINLNLFRQGTQIAGHLLYKADRFDAESMQGLRDAYLRLLEAITGDPELRLSALNATFGPFSSP
jgi:non-ribosomal peptide synthetase component F